MILPEVSHDVCELDHLTGELLVLILLLNLLHLLRNSIDSKVYLRVTLVGLTRSWHAGLSSHLRLLLTASLLLGKECCPILLLIVSLCLTEFDLIQLSTVIVIRVLTLNFLLVLCHVCSHLLQALQLGQMINVLRVLILIVFLTHLILIKFFICAKIVLSVRLLLLLPKKGQKSVRSHLHLLLSILGW